MTAGGSVMTMTKSHNRSRKIYCKTLYHLKTILVPVAVLHRAALHVPAVSSLSYWNVLYALR